MHREISHSDPNHDQDSQLSLYLLTALLGLLLAADLWPMFARWFSPWGLKLPSYSNEVYGNRLALFAAVLGGARASMVHSTLSSPAEWEPTWHWH